MERAGGGGEGDREGGLRRGPSLPPLSAPAPAIGTPVLPCRPGRVPGCSLFPAPSAKWLKRGGVPAGEGRGVCGWEGAGGVAWGVTYGGGARTRALARLGNGRLLGGRGGAGCADGPLARPQRSHCECGGQVCGPLPAHSPPFRRDGTVSSGERPRPWLCVGSGSRLTSGSQEEVGG